MSQLLPAYHEKILSKKEKMLMRPWAIYDRARTTTHEFIEQKEKW
jgi:hypothetical protein